VRDVFRVLSELLSQSFVVDADVKGTLGLDAEGAAPEDLFAAMETVGLKIGPGPLRRVSRGAAAPAGHTTTYSGLPINLALKSAGLVDVFRMFSEVTGLPILVPQELAGTTTIFASELPWDQVLDAIIVSAGLTLVLEGSRALIGPEAAVRTEGHPGFVEVTRAGGASTSHARRSWWTGPDRLEKLALDDLELAGLGRAGKEWSAYAVGPSGQFWSLAAGQALAGASVKSVGPTGVTFETASGPVEVPFRP
jgi:hypothetical protein